MSAERKEGRGRKHGGEREVEVDCLVVFVCVTQKRGADSGHQAVWRWFYVEGLPQTDIYPTSLGPVTSYTCAVRMMRCIFTDVIHFSLKMMVLVYWRV